MKLQNKITFYTAFIFAILLILLSLLIYYFFGKMITDSELSAIKKDVEKITMETGEALGEIPEDDLLRAYVPVNGMIRLITADNKSIVTITSSSEQDLSHQQPVYYPHEMTASFELKKRFYVYSYMPIIMPDGSLSSLQITKSIQHTTDILETLKIVLVAAIFLVLIPVLVSTRILSKLIVSPITSIIKTMSEIKEKSQFKRLTLEGESNDELSEMGKTFNHMIDLLEENFKKQEQFVSNASHELKTPLTIIESYASLLKRRGLTEPELFLESVEAIHSEAVHMKNLTQQLLLLARNEQNRNIEYRLIDSEKFLRDLARNYERAYSREVCFSMSAEGRCFVRTDEQKLKQLVFIFLDNARKYSKDSIILSVGTGESGIFISIADRGIGISNEELPRVFDRFYRVDQARERNHGGFGLGLSLAKEIAKAIGVEIKIESIVGEGTTATILFK